jgi:hypothetical protein
MYNYGVIWKDKNLKVSYFWDFRGVLLNCDGGAVENRTPVRNHATPNVYMLSEVV